MKKELVIVIDFGGQYNQLVARRVRECNVYCEIYSYKTDIEKIKAMNPKGIILTGGPNSCYEADSPTYKKELFELGIPVLGLCYGAQLMTHVLGGKVESAPVREYGKTEVLIDKKLPLSTLTAEVVIYPQLLKNVRVANKAAAKANLAVQKAVEDVAEALGDDGRILVRESGTEPVIRVMVEAPDDATCAKYVDQVVSVMHKEGLVTE